MLRSLFLSALAATTALCASLQQVSNFGQNPSGIQMYIYVPDRLASNPAVVVSVRKFRSRGEGAKVANTRTRSCTRAAAREPSGSRGRRARCNTPTGWASS